MDRNYVIKGMLVGYEGQVCSILDKQKSTCSLLCISTGTRIDEVPFENLAILPGASAHNKYVNSLTSKQSNQQCLFSKNENKDYIFEDGSKVWFTSDTHFCHDKILDFCKRPFLDIREMNECLIQAWNEVVQPDDTIFHLGDFCWGKSQNWNHILNQLNGHIHLIVGNHDVKNMGQMCLQQFESISFQKQIVVEGRSIYLNHYPFLAYGGTYRSEDKLVYQLFGHVHTRHDDTGKDSQRMRYKLPTQYDVGVDNNGYEPVNFKEVEKIIQNQISEYNKEHS